MIALRRPVIQPLTELAVRTKMVMASLMLMDFGMSLKAQMPSVMTRLNRRTKMVMDSETMPLEIFLTLAQLNLEIHGKTIPSDAWIQTKMAGLIVKTNNQMTRPNGRTLTVMGSEIISEEPLQMPVLDPSEIQLKGIDTVVLILMEMDGMI